MASMDDAKRDESGESVPPEPDRGEPGFGPPVGSFGPPLDTFGPPTGASGAAAAVGWQPADAPERPAVGWQPADAPERPAVGWQPADAPERPAVGWQPADAPERPIVGWQPADTPAAPPVPAPPPQYRAPDTGSHETVRGSVSQYRAPDTSGSHEIVRGPAPQYRPPNSTGSQETVRYSDQGQAGYPPASAPPRETPRSLWDDDDLAKKLIAPREPSVAAKGGAGKGSSSGSLWDDDDLAKQLAQMAPHSAPDTAPVEPRRSRGVLIGGVVAAVVVVAVLAGVIVFLMRGHGDNSGNAHGPVAAPSSSGLACQAFSDGTLTVGNGAGDTSSGPGVILGFQHAYYTDRSGARARTFVTPDSNISAADILQQAINQQIPQGTTYCVRIIAASPGSFNVEITEQHPDGRKTVYSQRITTVNQGGRTLISAINDH